MLFYFCIILTIPHRQNTTSPAFQSFDFDRSFIVVFDGYLTSYIGCQMSGILKYVMKVIYDDFASCVGD